MKRYLYVIGMIGLFVSVMFSGLIVHAKGTSWKKKYQDFVNKHSLDSDVIGYALLDKNSTPELITHNGSVYTIRGGKVKKLKTTAYLRVDYYWDKGNCFYYVGCDAEGGVQISYSAIKNGKIVTVKEFEYSGNRAVGREAWRIDGKEVTHSEYDEQLSSFKEKLDKKYGKAKAIKYKDYTRYHYNDKGTHQYTIYTEQAKITIKKNLLIVKGPIESISGTKHIFKLTPSTFYWGGDVPSSKKKFKESIKIKGGFVIIETKNGKVIRAGGVW